MQNELLLYGAVALIFTIAAIALTDKLMFNLNRYPPQKEETERSWHKWQHRRDDVIVLHAMQAISLGVVGGALLAFALTLLKVSELVKLASSGTLGVAVLVLFWGFSVRKVLEKRKAIDKQWRAFQLKTMKG